MAIRTVPILRKGIPYLSLDQLEVKDFITGEPLARVSQANSGLISRDLRELPGEALPLRDLSASELVARTKSAGDLFLSAELPFGDGTQTQEEYLSLLSRTSGLPLSLCRSNQQKIYGVMNRMEEVLGGLTRGLDLSILDRGFGSQDGRMLSYIPQARWLGVILPSNSPGVHSLWIPSIPLKTGLCLKPGRDEPWSPYRIVQALIAAGIPREALGYYPTDHAGAGTILSACERSMLFGDTSTTKTWEKDERVQCHGPGWSKVLIGEDVVENWPQYVDVVATSVAANGGRSCINASGVWLPRHGREFAEALAERLRAIDALPLDHPDARLAAFVNPQFAEMIDATIEQALDAPGAIDVTREIRGSGRLVRRHGATYLLPTVIWCEDREHSLVHKEFLFPFVSVVECPQSEMIASVGSTLVGSAVTNDEEFREALLRAPNVDRLNFGAIPTCHISWDQPHEGNLFEHLYRQRAFQHVARAL
jgi:acyl-CoA reductase-like NAD-dependent aldehyde dehydrogenase